MITDRLQNNLNEGSRLGLDADPYGPRGPTMRHTGVTGSQQPVPLSGTAVPKPVPNVGGTTRPKPVPTTGNTGGLTPPPVPTTQNPIVPGAPGNGVSPILTPNPGTYTPGSGPTTAPPSGGGGYSGPSGMDAGRRVTDNELVNNQLNSLLNSNSQYIRNARQRGVEMAGARGMVNSSIAAGASQRAAIEAGLPIATADAQAYRSANDQTYGALQQLRQMRVAGDIQNWLSSESFNREYNGALAMMPIRASMDMLTYVTQRGLEDPSVYTPDVLSGFNNFFNMNMFDVMGRFYGTGSTPGGG